MIDENNITNEPDFSPENESENIGQNGQPEPPEFEENHDGSADTPNVTHVVYIPYGFTPETFAEKRQIRKTALAVGLPSIALSIFTFVWSFIYLFATTKIAGLSYNDAVKLASEPAVQQILQIFVSCVMFLLPFPRALKCCGYTISETVNLKSPEKGDFLPFFGVGIGFCAFANIAMSYSSMFFSGLGFEYHVDYGDNPEGFFGFLLTFIATAIVPALVEEFACRGIVIGLLKKYGEAFAIITSAIVFGVMHGNFDQMPFAVIVGLILGYIYVKTGSLWASVAVHCTNNAISVIFTYFEKIMPSYMQNAIYTLYILICLFAAICGIYAIAKKNPDRFALKTSDTAASEGQKYKWFFTSWAIIVFLALNIIDSFTYFV